jgi:mRNA interferase MazF
MARPLFIPDRGDFVWIDLDPQKGREQAGRRPALVLSQHAYNRKTGLCVVCPATSKSKGYEFEVPNPDADDPQTVILVDQIRCVDWRQRPLRFIHRVADEVLDEAVAKLDAFLINPDA